MTNYRRRLEYVLEKSTDYEAIMVAKALLIHATEDGKIDKRLRAGVNQLYKEVA